MVGTEKISQLYMTIYAQEFSPCGSFLAACNSYGEVAVYDLQTALAYPSKKSHRTPKFKFRAHDDPVFCMTTSDGFLLSGSVGLIKAWAWEDLVHSALTGSAMGAPRWSLVVPIDKVVGCRPEINEVVVRNDVVYGAAGDGVIYAWSLKNGHLCHKFLGHSDYIHCLAVKEDRLIFSGSEDGTVRCWDTNRDSKPVFVLEPHSHSSCSRPKMGKWISCIDVEEDRLLCGGGPHLALFHLKMITSPPGPTRQNPTAPLVIFNSPASTSTHNLVRFHESGLLSSGSSSQVHYWDLSGRLGSSVASSSSAVYSVAINESSSKYPVTTFAGSSDKIDVCISKGYSSSTLIF